MSVPFIPPTVYAAAGLGYFVASRTVQPGAYWLVSGDTCTCPATRRCWHIRQVQAHVRALEPVRELVPVNVSSMVD